MRFVGIDPGVGGCIAWIEGTKIGFSPAIGKLTIPEIIDYLVLHKVATTNDICCVIEKVHSAPGMGVSSAFKFGKGYGELIGILGALKIPYVEVSPVAWQNALKCRVVKKKKPKTEQKGKFSSNEDYKANKNAHKVKATKLMPRVKITLTNCDALLIAKYCQQHHKELF